MIGGARYLVRFDDICPGMNWRVWGEIEKILVDGGVKPMLAVVPANDDPQLDVAPREPGFWERVRGWQARGSSGSIRAASSPGCRRPSRRTSCAAPSPSSPPSACAPTSGSRPGTRSTRRQ
jgi:hypothetical protein